MKRLLQIFIVIIPLIVSFSTSDPSLAIRFLSLGLVTGVFLLIMLFTNRLLFVQVLKQPVFIVMIIILLCFLCSLFFNGFTAEGIYILLKMCLGFVFCFIVVHIFLEYGIKGFLNSFVLFSLFLSAIYVYQFMANYTEIMSLKGEWERNNAFNSLAATMGHKNLLSSIQFLILPFLLYSIKIGQRIWKFLALFAILLIGLTFLQTQTRAVFVALFFALATFFMINRQGIRLKHIFLLFSSLIFAIFLAYFVLDYTNRLERFKVEFSGILTDASVQSRYKLYASTLQLISDYPVLGVGPANWKIAIWKYGLYKGTIGDSFAQRPHNDFLWVFAEAGFFAGISYILLFLVLLREAYLLHNNREEEDGLIYAFLFAAVVGYGFISLVDFPMERLSHIIMFFLLAAIIIASKLKQTKFSKASLPAWCSYVFLIFICFSVYVGLIRYQSEVHAANAIHYKSKAKWNYVVKAIDKAYDPIYYQMENTATPLLWYRGVAYFNQKRYDLALKDFQDAYIVNPFHVHVLNNLATSWQIKGDSKKAKKFYRDVFKVNPTFKEARVNLAAILFNERKYLEALDVILASKVDPYWKRKRKNDNYDLYLKTIAQAWINSVYISTSAKQQEALNRWKHDFEKRPKYAEEKAKAIFEIRNKKEVNYLAALMLSDLKKSK